MQPETLAAIATPPGRGGIAVIRLSGPQALTILAALADRPPSSFVDRRATLCRLSDRGTHLDTALAIAMRGPHSFTGEDVVELHAHGGTANSRRILSACLFHGATPAEPGAFTRRAVLAGKLDLVQAESLLRVIEATSDRELKIAHAQLQGALGTYLAELETLATHALTHVEAHLDFPEEGLGRQQLDIVLAALTQLLAGCDALIARFQTTRLLQRGVTVALTGPVNVGKSSLLNALLGHQRALVSDIPGTTRDYVEAHVQWDGVDVTLIDTAGVRTTTDPIEHHGIELSLRRTETADVVLAIDSNPLALPPPSSRVMPVVTKVDQLEPSATEKLPAAITATSSVTGLGLDTLRERILAKLELHNELLDGPSLVSERQQQHLLAVQTAVGNALSLLTARAALDLAVVALELHQARRELAMITGTDPTETLLDQIFATFCIGK